MNWEALKNYKCPKCGCTLRESALTAEFKDSNVPARYNCSKKECDFRISGEKLSSIVRDMLQPKPARRCITFEENLHQLNNMGHEESPTDGL